MDSTASTSTASSATKINLTELRNCIDGLSIENHIRIARFLQSNASVVLNDTNGGIAVNLSMLDNDTLTKLADKVKFICTQEVAILNMEQQISQCRTNLNLKKEDNNTNG